MTQNYRGLKSAVIIMGVLLVLGTIALVVGMVRQAGRISDHFDKPALVQNTILPPDVAGKVVQMQMDGGRLLLLVEQAGGKQKILVLDLASGAVLSTVDPAAALP